MTQTTTDFKNIFRLSGNINIDALTNTTTDLKDSARFTFSSRVIIVIRNTSNKTTTNIKDIAILAPG